MAKELGQRQIVLNVVSSDAIETDFTDGVVRDNPEINSFIASQTALGRLGLTDDIGGVLAKRDRWYRPFVRRKQMGECTEN